MKIFYGEVSKDSKKNSVFRMFYILHSKNKIFSHCIKSCWKKRIFMLNIQQKHVSYHYDKAYARHGEELFLVPSAEKIPRTFML